MKIAISILKRKKIIFFITPLECFIKGEIFNLKIINIKYFKLKILLISINIFCVKYVKTQFAEMETPGISRYLKFTIIGIISRYSVKKRERVLVGYFIEI